MLRLVGLAVAGAVALAVGANLLSSVVGVVTALRAGDVVPLIIVAVTTVILLRLSAKPSENRTPVHVLLEVLGWTSAIYLFVVVLMWVLPFGMVPAILAAGITAMLCGLVRDPTGLNEKMSRIVDASSSLGLSPTGLGITSRLSGTQSMWARINRLRYKVIIIPPKHIDTVIGLLKDRPKLPVSLTRLEDTDALIVRDEEWADRVLVVLGESGVPDAHIATPLLEKAIIALPLLEQEHGVKVNDYQFACDPNTVEKLLVLKPLRMTVFPNPNGLVVMVFSDSVLGLNLQPLPIGREASAVVARDISRLPRGEPAIGNTT
jgi:hypothetical protein